MSRKNRSLTTCIGVFILLACSGVNRPTSEIRVAIEMSAADFNAQVSVQDIGNPLSESDSDFWGTDDPHQLIIGLPKGNIQFDSGGYGNGTMLASTPLSPTSEITSVGRIRSVTFGMFREKYSLSEAVDIAKDQCNKIKFLFDNPRFEYGENFFSEAENLDVGGGLYVCGIQNREIDFVVSLRKDSLATRSDPSSGEFVIEGWVGRNTEVN